jgi:hypothetical protein
VLTSPTGFSCPVLAVGAELENPAALAQAYLDFFAGG